MTQKSWPWSTVTALGDGAAQLNEALSREFLALWFGVQNPAVEGVSKGVGGELAVTGAASPLSVASGSAICYGLYINDAAVNTPAITTPAVGTTGGRVVLQTNWAGTGGGSLEARTRVAVKKSADGVAAIPAVTQVFGTTWEITLATFTITTGGVITVTDARTFRRSTGVVGTAELELLAIATALLADNGVTNPKLRDSAAVSVIGRSANSAGDPADIAAGANDRLLARVADALAFVQLTAGMFPAGVVPVGGLADGAVNTTAKLANDIVDDTKAGNRVVQTTHRQGASATDWASAGGSTQTPTAIREQVGSKDYSISGGSLAGTVAVTFPVAFSQPPVILVTPNPTVLAGDNRNNFNSLMIHNVTASGFQASWARTSSQDGVGGAIHWRAIGPL